jgi:nucleotide-binding universal stress UspA family protein
MASLALLCTDGSDLAQRAISAGLSVLQPTDRMVLATVSEPVDPTLVTGMSGFGTATMGPQQYEEVLAAHRAEAEQALMDTRHALDLGEIETILVDGEPGPALCELAAELGATVMVAGTRGRGGIRRAVLGSVSDHLVRHAPCPILITGPRDDEVETEAAPS